MIGNKLINTWIERQLGGIIEVGIVWGMWRQQCPANENYKHVIKSEMLMGLGLVNKLTEPHSS